MFRKTTDRPLPMVLTFVIFILMTACFGQNQSLNKEALQLENFDLDTKITTLLPEDTKDETDPEIYNVKNTSLQKIILYDDEYSAERKATGIEYRGFKSRSTDELAKFGSFKFNTINIATTVSNEITVVNAVAGKIDMKESSELIQSLNHKYGQAEKSKGDFMKPFPIYSWKLKDRIIKYVPLFDQGNSTMSITIDKEKKTIEKGQQNPHFKGLLFVINSKYSGDVVGKFHTGDLLYCQ